MDDEKNVYIVVQYVDEGTEILGVFTTEEKAQAYINFYAPDAAIELWTLDATGPIPADGKKLWNVEVNQDLHFGRCRHIPLDFNDGTESCTWGTTRDQRHWWLSCYVLARDREEAERLASERLTLALANGSLEEAKRRAAERQAQGVPDFLWALPAKEKTDA